MTPPLQQLQQTLNIIQQIYIQTLQTITTLYSTSTTSPSTITSTTPPATSTIPTTTPPTIISPTTASPTTPLHPPQSTLFHTVKKTTLAQKIKKNMLILNQLHSVTFWWKLGLFYALQYTYTSIHIDLNWSHLNKHFLEWTKVDSGNITSFIVSLKRKKKFDQNFPFIHVFFIFMFCLFHCYALINTEKNSKPVDKVLIYCILNDNNYHIQKYFFCYLVCCQILIFPQK